MAESDWKDLKLAVWVVIMAFSVGAILGLWVGKAQACDSYEDCMKTWKVYESVPFEQRQSSDASPVLLKAIAYKLDEISKKLDK